MTVRNGSTEDPLSTLTRMPGIWPALAAQGPRVAAPIGEGFSTPENADRLGVRRGTAKHYVSRVLAFMRPRGRAEAAQGPELTRSKAQVAAFVARRATDREIAGLPRSYPLCLRVNRRPSAQQIRAAGFPSPMASTAQSPSTSSLASARCTSALEAGASRAGRPQPPPRRSLRRPRKPRFFGGWRTLRHCSSWPTATSMSWRCGSGSTGTAIRPPASQCSRSAATSS